MVAVADVDVAVDVDADAGVVADADAAIEHTAFDWSDKRESVVVKLAAVMSAAADYSRLPGGRR